MFMSRERDDLSNYINTYTRWRCENNALMRILHEDMIILVGFC